MENNYRAILSFLGLLYSGRRISFGDILLNEVKGKKVKLVIYASDSGESVKKKLLDKCFFYNVECIELFNKVELGTALGKGELSAIGIYDYKAIQKIKDILKKEGTSDEK